MEVTRRAVSCFTILLAAAVCALLNARAQEPNNPPPTFSKDVAPILQKHCHNEGSLAPAEIRELVTWVNGGAQEGDPKDMPPPVKEFGEGWGLPQPDIVFQLPKPFSVPAAGVIEYQYVIVPTGFKEDKWVQMLEVRPTDRAVVHHIIAYLREPGSNYFKDQKPGVFFIAPPPKVDEKTDTSALPSDFLVRYAPGQAAQLLHPG